MRKLITLLLAILMSLLPALTGTQTTARQFDTYDPTAVTEYVYEPTSDIETEPIVTVTAEPEATATEPPVAAVEEPHAEISTDPKQYPTRKNRPL